VTHSYAFISLVKYVQYYARNKDSRRLFRVPGTRGIGTRQKTLKTVPPFYYEHFVEPATFSQASSSYQSTVLEKKTHAPVYRRLSLLERYTGAVAEANSLSLLPMHVSSRKGNASCERVLTGIYFYDH
jgi:hypothetical protein